MCYQTKIVHISFTDKSFYRPFANEYLGSLVTVSGSEDSLLSDRSRCWSFLRRVKPGGTAVQWFPAASRRLSPVRFSRPDSSLVRRLRLTANSWRPGQFSSNTVGRRSRPDAERSSRSPPPSLSEAWYQKCVTLHHRKTEPLYTFANNIGSDHAKKLFICRHSKGV